MAAAAVGKGVLPDQGSLEEGATVEIEATVAMGAIVQTFPDEGPDTWDDNLVPVSLIKEIYDELLPTPSSWSSSDESYDFVTDSGTVIRMKRRKQAESEEESSEEGEDEIYRVPSVPDIEGGIPKEQLQAMSIKEIEDCLGTLESQIEFLNAENLILERTIARMEQRDREIEAAMPIFTYKYPWENDSANGNTSAASTDSEGAAERGNIRCVPVTANKSSGDMQEEEEEAQEEETEKKRKRKKKKSRVPKVESSTAKDGKIKELCDWADEAYDKTEEYIPIDPTKEISVSNDKFFAGMSPEDKQAAKIYIQNYGLIAPANYDYMRHKYGKLIKGFFSQKDETTDQKKTNVVIDSDVHERQKIFDEVEGLGDEDPDFPGFFPRTAKRLPLEYKLKYAEEEFEALQKDIMANRTYAKRRQNSIQVLIDTNVDAYELLTALNEALTEVIADAYHPLTKRLMAEKILKFRKTLRNKLLAEETKITMSLVELKKTRKKVQEQLKAQKEMGFKLQKIDFEQIRIRNNEYAMRIENAHEELKGLKLLTAGCFQILKDERQKLSKKFKQHERMTNDIHLRETLMLAFQNDLSKYTQILDEVQARNAFMRKRLRAFKVPNSLEYIRLKAIYYGLEEEVGNLKHRLKSLDMSRHQKRNQLESLTKSLPQDVLSTLQDEGDWLEMIKKEVAEKDLLKILSAQELADCGVHTVSAEDKKRIKHRQYKERQANLNYDPEEDTKSLTEIRATRLKKSVQSDGKSLASKSKNLSNGSGSDRCPAKYRRTPRGNLVVDNKEGLRIEFLTKC